MPFNSPLPASLASECRKASRILNGFIDPGQGLDKVIPPGILRNAKGLAIMTVLKGAFMFGGRAGSGLVVARLADGSWSAPSAIGTFGFGFGGQIGGELTDFVMVLQTQAAVKAFMNYGNVTLGGNISVAAGPVGRNAELAGSASMRSVAAVYSYSKTRGLFAGVSLEGSVIVERFDANAKMYGHKVKASDLLGGNIPPPSEAGALYQALDSRFYSSSTANYDFRQQGYHQSPFNDSPPVSDNSNGLNRSQTFNRAAVKSMATGGGGRARSASTSSNQRQQQQPAGGSGRYGMYDNDILGSPDRSLSTPDRPAITDGKLRARALFNFPGEQSGDLPFKKGDTIVIVKKSETQQDWWTGEIGSRTGVFPANFVELV